MTKLAIGFRVKSGYAVAVVVAGPASAPTAVARQLVELSDPRVPTTRQPHHNGFGTAQEDVSEIRRLTRIIERSAKQSVTALLVGDVFRDGVCQSAALVVGSVIDPATVGNPHIRAHAHEGRLFRVVLEEALEERGIGCLVVVEKLLAAEAQKTLGRTGREVTRVLGSFGESLGSPWRTEEKAAATAAWMALARRQRTARKAVR